ncbi:MAG TPA: class I SAM-dependent methyltransferase [Acidimicrobiales bacterium]
MPEQPPSPQRFYHELAPWWPLLSPVDEYEAEAAEFARLITTTDPAAPVRDVLELGSGGGHNAFHLKRQFTMTLVDIADEMLEQSRRLNPECEHVQGDMRDVRLGRTFDAVFVHDAVMYLTTDADLRAAMRTAYVHCRPGGVTLIAPDWIAETFQPGTSHGGADAADGRGARYLEWSWDPDPDDTEARSEFAFLLRDADGTVRMAHDSHVWGLFPRDVWLRVLASEGFEVEAVTERTDEDRPPRELYVCRRPGRNDGSPSAS